MVDIDLLTENPKNFYKIKPECVEIILFDNDKNTYVCSVSHQDFSKVSPIKWRVQRNTENYLVVVATNKGTTITLGSFLLNPPPELECDHINRNTLDNTRGNLRSVTRRQNCYNRGAGLFVNKFKGVHFDKARMKWCAQIKVNGKNKNIGRFLSQEEAAYAYNQMAKKHYGDHAFLNKV